MNDIYISAAFECGNIEVVEATNAKNIQLKIRKDTNADFFQWFCFRVQCPRQEQLNMHILNAGESSYPEGWDDYNAVVSYDGEEWFRVPTTYDGKALHIDFCSEYNSFFVAYFAPYTYERHQKMLGVAQMHPQAELYSIGKTYKGKAIDMLRIGEPSTDKKKVWMIARQHPGESMAEWFAEGFINRLTDEDDALSRQVLQQAVFYIIPNVNIDGSIAGNLRANAAGKNLNRAWGNPNEITEPEVYHIMKQMENIGVDMMLDIHGDEALPYNFISSIEGIPSFNNYLKTLLEDFKTAWQHINPDFQTTEGYPINEPGTANLNICSKAIGEKFHCLSLTLEMPFKDNANYPDEVYGWSPDRSILLGRSMLHPIAKVLPQISNKHK